MIYNLRVMIDELRLTIKNLRFMSYDLPCLLTQPGSYLCFSRHCERSEATLFTFHSALNTK